MFFEILKNIYIYIYLPILVRLFPSKTSCKQPRWGRFILKLCKMENLTVFNYNGNEIAFKEGDNMMINATQMAKPFNKRPNITLAYHLLMS